MTTSEACIATDAAGARQDEPVAQNDDNLSHGGEKMKMRARNRYGIFKT